MNPAGLTPDSRNPSATPSVAVIIPCHNEEAPVANVVAGFKRVLPDARVIVVDNASTDGTADAARLAGAEVIVESRRGKGFAVLRGLRHVPDAGVCFIVDGDDTYPAEAAPLFIQRIAAGADMVIGSRLADASNDAFPAGHFAGNRMFLFVVRLLFGIRTKDLFSGYRALSQRLLLHSPLIAQGFEIEAELTIQAYANRFRVDEVPVSYRARATGSGSKLRTLHDGYRILVAILAFFRDYRPMVAFGWTAALLLAASLASGRLVVEQYLATGQVLRVPMAILAAAFFILSALSLTAGIVLSSINRRAEEIRSLLVSSRYLR